MMTSSNGNIFRVTGPLCGEFNGDRWILHTKASDADLFFDLRPNKRLSTNWNNGEAGDSRRHRVHYAVTIMSEVSFKVPISDKPSSEPMIITFSDNDLV